MNAVWARAWPWVRGTALSAALSDYEFQPHEWPFMPGSPATPDHPTPRHIVSFSAVFGISQQLGGLGGAALLGSFQIVRERFHSEVLTQALLPTDPSVALRLQQLGGAYARVLSDPALRQAQGCALLGQQVARWAYCRWTGTNPLAEELAALAAMRNRTAP